MSNPPTAVFWIYTLGGVRALGSCHLVVFLGNCMLCFSSLSSVQSFSRVRLFATPWTAARQASLSITNSGSLPELISSIMFICWACLLAQTVKEKKKC